jgi:hypothetical protein
MLAASHISAIAIAVLIFFSVELFVRACFEVLPRVVDFVVAAIAVGGMPYISPRSSLSDQLSLTPALYYLFLAIASFVCSWLLSRWVYSVGPFVSLRRYGLFLARRNHA